MPPVNYPPAGVLFATLQELQQQITALQNQQTIGVNNPNGQAQVKIGLQTDNTFGISVLGPLGVLQRVGGVGSSYVQSEGTYDSTSWGPITPAAGTPGDSTVTVQIGPSGLAFVFLAAFIIPGSYSEGETAQMSVSFDGDTPSARPGVAAQAGPDSEQIFVTSYGWTASFTPGQHTLKPIYSVSTEGVVATYAARSLVVFPL
jgi:hypothetical protein